MKPVPRGRVAVNVGIERLFQTGATVHSPRSDVVGERVLQPQGHVPWCGVNPEFRVRLGHQGMLSPEVREAGLR